MNVVLTIVIALLTALLSALGAGLVSGLCAEWYRISSHEGGSSYFVAFMALLGFVAGLVIGIIGARMSASPAGPVFLKGVGISFAAVIAILLIVVAIAWVGADLPPKLDGKKLDLEVEAKIPPGIPVLANEEPGRNNWYLTLTAMHGKRIQQGGRLFKAQARQAEGIWIVPGKIFLHTTDSMKSLGVALGERPTQFFDLPLASRPTTADREWTGWSSAAHTGDLVNIPAADAISIRYRIQDHVDSESSSQ